MDFVLERPRPNRSIWGGHSGYNILQWALICGVLTLGISTPRTPCQTLWEGGGTLGMFCAMVCRILKVPAVSLCRAPHPMVRQRGPQPKLGACRRAGQRAAGRAPEAGLEESIPKQARMRACCCRVHLLFCKCLFSVCCWALRCCRTQAQGGGSTYLLCPRN